MTQRRIEPHKITNRRTFAFAFLRGRTKPTGCSICRGDLWPGRISGPRATTIYMRVRIGPEKKPRHVPIGVACGRCRKLALKLDREYRRAASQA